MRNQREVFAKVKLWRAQYLQSLESVPEAVPQLKAHAEGFCYGVALLEGDRAAEALRATFDHELTDLELAALKSGGDEHPKDDFYTRLRLTFWEG